MTLCNACGLYYKSKGVHRPKVPITRRSQLDKYKRIMDYVTTELGENTTKIVQVSDGELYHGLTSCMNCKCINTSLWRKDPHGRDLCNACGLYYKKNGIHRAIKRQDGEVFIEIDQKLIRLNKVKRRARTGRKQIILGKNGIASPIIITSGDSSPTELYTVQPSPTRCSTLHPELVSTRAPVMGELHVAPELRQRTTNENMITDFPRLPPISILLNELDGQTM